ncbi:hypothetical protein PCANC_06580 [Puccinia coronata f. sp. avenae]|uniref:Uncharacterized protein n=1 Tax=Puccinia coronata f. sp. avenae TaxID=200324 RepID=A0A2N5VA39_9BASI|nr:hypothetical protein PCANC_06580 [Puccinia coronata f. sp. avenae]
MILILSKRFEGPTQLFFTPSQLDCNSTQLLSFLVMCELAAFMLGVLGVQAVHHLKDLGLSELDFHNTFRFLQYTST